MRQTFKYPSFWQVPLDDKIAEAIEFIREHEPPDGYISGFSGGKDSIVTEKLMVLSGVKYFPIYNCTRIDPPEVVRFIKEKYPHVQFLYPEITFWHGIMTKNPPSLYQRWCCEYLKHKPSFNLPQVRRIFGIRKEESNKRATYPRINVYKRGPKQVQYYPILEWNEADVWEFIETQGLAYPSLYDEGFDRLGCVVCPFRGPAIHAFWRRRWPGIYHTFEVVVTKWWLMKQATGHEMRHHGPDEFLQSWYRKDFKMFKNEDDEPLFGLLEDEVMVF